MENILLFGAGNHLSTCIDIIHKEGKYNIIGIVDSVKEIGIDLFGYKLIGRQDQLKTITETFQVSAGIIAIGDNWSRKLVFDEIALQCPDFKFITIIHPSAIIAMGVTLGKGVIIGAGCILNAMCEVGNFCLFLTGSQLEHDGIMDDFSSLSAGCITGGKVRIGKYAALSLGVIVLDRLTIGENTVVGAGSLVMKDLPDHVLAYGTPAIVIRKREPGERFLKPD